MPATPIRQIVPGSPDDVALYFICDSQGSATGADTDVLDSAEHARADAFRFPSDRDRFIRAHGLQRRVLTALVPAVPAGAWRFSRPEKGGKPFAVAPDGVRAPCFSLTHCEGLIAVALSDRRDVGIDAERTHRRELSADLARGSFAPVEIARLSGFVPDGRTLARLWCGKEALAKGIGRGLALDFAELVIDPGTGAIERDAPPLHAAEWKLTFPPAPHGFTLAVAWRRD